MNPLHLSVVKWVCLIQRYKIYTQILLYTIGILFTPYELRQCKTASQFMFNSFIHIWKLMPGTNRRHTCFYCRGLNSPHTCKNKCCGDGLNWSKKFCNEQKMCLGVHCTFHLISSVAVLYFVSWWWCWLS